MSQILQTSAVSPGHNDKRRDSCIWMLALFAPILLAQCACVCEGHSTVLRKQHVDVDDQQMEACRRWSESFGFQLESATGYATAFIAGKESSVIMESLVVIQCVDSEKKETWWLVILSDEGTSLWAETSTGPTSMQFKRKPEDNDVAIFLRDSSFGNYDFHDREVLLTVYQTNLFALPLIKHSPRDVAESRRLLEKWEEQSDYSHGFTDEELDSLK